LGVAEVLFFKQLEEENKKLKQQHGLGVVTPWLSAD
jgi:hypothetical protein